MTIYTPKGYQDPQKKESTPSLVEITGMWATLATTALCAILMIYKLLQ